MSQLSLNKSFCPRKRTARFHSQGNFKHFVQATEINVLYPIIKENKRLPAKIEISNYNYKKDDKDMQVKEYASYRMEGIGNGLAYLAGFLIALREYSRITGIKIPYIYSKIDTLLQEVKKGTYDYMINEYKGK